MQKDFSYQDYVRDQTFLEDYNDYQRKYAETIRESDRIMVELVRSVVARRKAVGPLELLDIGCSTGNLLLHLKRMVPELRLYGGDLAASSLEQCRSNNALDGIEFAEMNILTLPPNAFDIIVVNAVLYMLDDEEYQRALVSLYRSLRPNGTVLLFDFAHPFKQEIAILETTDSHPNGLRLHFRSAEKIVAMFDGAGFQDARIQPFELPIDLPRHEDDSQIITYTITDHAGRRMAFRGAIYQPWCHMMAWKSGTDTTVSQGPEC